MPPRLPTLQRLGSTSLCLRPAAKPSSTPNFLPITQTANLSLRERKRKAKQDPYAWAQAQQRKNANLKRKEEIKRQHEGDGVDPIHGVLTPFVESLDTAGQARHGRVQVDAKGKPVGEAPELPYTEGLRNFFLTDAELEEAAKNAYTLTKPMVGVVESQMGSTSEEELLKVHEEKHARAVEAMKRITSLSNASSKDLYHANVQRVIEEFGRHNTDNYLKQKPSSIDPNHEERTPRAGPDTGSSEVQIAILTTKIRGLTRALKINRGYKDKANARNLELLVHRRQKLLKYMERKERGSERWTNMLEKLGLTKATWKGQITTRQ